ncbi:periodic tryptophan protein 2 [Thecamonas trahens ATCC 50062]|uniref:Periodic tryptophan protein 2 n=1 Tax=Thecamonas trahens ATCC 50062 TaxID=461836 RepID=A0A0L0DEE1_THETB|nr:periodic tryptophan protein 2 [Thecamonas trahens ATCC 50062]KNC50531.1 periodic tryptophan protein 2 [Thecamonas trahens ATCC 50062]|eukprot:XP_013762423.1 periodic tryptophan protein 2 [Thecamonas trahens ATCC 50062]
MKFGYQFQNLCGSVYRSGDVVFTPDGNTVLSPVGNRVTRFDLLTNTSSTLAFEARSDISKMAVSADGVLLMVVDVEGYGSLINLKRGAVLHRINFKGIVNAMAFSPLRGYLAVAVGSKVVLWYLPLAAATTKTFAPMIKLKELAGHVDDVLCLSFSGNGRFMVTGSADLTARVHALFPPRGKSFRSITLAGHRDVVVAAFFDAASSIVYTVARDAAVLTWEWIPPEVLEEYSYSDGEYSDVEAAPELAPELAAMQIEGASENAAGASGAGNDDDVDEDADQAFFGSGWVNKDKFEAMSGSSGGTELAENAQEKEEEEEREELLGGTWKRVAKHLFKQDFATVSSATMHAASSLLVVGFSSGVFGLYQMPSVTAIHTLSVSSTRISSVTVNASGEWLAFGSAALGQLVVWEWQSETFVLKQQGHAGTLNCVSYSPDGLYMATGSDDAKVKVWSTTTGFCFGNALFSASTDGTIRAFDMTRYRCFRTYATPTPAQLTCMAIDPVADVVVAGSLDEFVIYVWDVKTARLLEMLSGHTAPVSTLHFSPVSNMLVSGSWDGSLKVWDVFNSLGRAGGGSIETFEASTSKAAVTCVAWAPNDKLIAAGAMNGTIVLWDPREGKTVGIIHARNDITGGRTAGSATTALNNPAGKFFTSLAFTADSTCLLAGGESKYVCIYEVSQQLLIKRFQLSHNRSLDGVLDELNSKYVGQDGWDVEESHQDDKDHLRALRRKAMPGSLKAVRDTYKFVVACSDISFSPTGRSWAAATPEGLLVYSLDNSVLFDPIDLDVDITPDAAREALDERDFTTALLIALRLNEDELTSEVYQAVPLDTVGLLVSDVPEVYLDRLVAFVARQLTASPHVHFHLVWIQALFREHSRAIRRLAATLGGPLTHLQKALASRADLVTGAAKANKHKLAYFTHVHAARAKAATAAAASSSSSSPAAMATE